MASAAVPNRPMVIWKGLSGAAQSTSTGVVEKKDTAATASQTPSGRGATVRALGGAP